MRLFYILKFQMSDLDLDAQLLCNKTKISDVRFGFRSTTIV